jgi:Ca-activated chloride channel family protein
VTVVGPDAKPIAGLRQDQFEVFEDGVPQTLKFFASGDLPLDVVILLDISSSMAGSMELVQQAALRLVRGLRPGDRATVMGPSSGLRVLQPLTRDMADVSRAIRQAKAGARTALYASIYTALNELAKVRSRDESEPRCQALVVLSDGEDTASGLAFDDLMQSVRREAVPIYTIAPRPSRTMRAKREASFGESTHELDFELRRLAAETGARAFFPVAPHELTGVYGNIADELARQYALGYQSSNQARDRAFRRIALRVNIPGAKWRTRPGYRPTRVVPLW